MGLKNTFLVIFFSFLSFFAKSQRTVILSDSLDQYSVAYDCIEIYEDKTNALSITKISSDDFQYRFKQNTVQLPRNYNRKSAYWIKFKIKNTSKSDKSWLFEYFDSSIKDISFYAPDGRGGYIEYLAGNKYPFISKFYKHKNFEFHIPDIKDQELTFYARIQSDHLVFMYGVVRSYTRFVFYALNEYYFLGIFYGIILAMAIYNFLLFITVRDRTYLYYVLYVLSSGFLCMVMDGTGFQYLWPNFPDFNDKAFKLSTFLMVIWAIMYTQGFVAIKSHSRFHFNILETVIIIRMVLFIMSITLFPSLSEFVFVDVVALLICYVSGIVSYKSGNAATKYFVLGFTFLFIGFIISNLTVHSIFGLSLPNNIFTVYSFNFAIVVEMILLSYALAERVRLILKENSEAQQAVIAQLRENDELKEKVNKELEEKVQERTAKISHQKQELEAKNQELEFLYSELNQNIEVAKLIQLSILPPVELIKKHLPHSYVVYKPKDVVSGDFYWFEYKNDKVYIAAVDCTGHGVAGAFMSLIGYNILNQIVRNPENKDLNAAQVLDLLNQNVIEALRQNSRDGYSRDGMDINLCIIDIKNKKLSYAGAVNYLYIIRNCELIKLIADPFSIGIPKSGEVSKFTNHDFDLLPGDQLIQYTDGYADQLGGDNGYKKFLYPRFRDMFLSICSLPIDEQAKIVGLTIEEWRGVQEQTDDILVMSMII